MLDVKINKFSKPKYIKESKRVDIENQFEKMFIREQLIDMTASYYEYKPKVRRVFNYSKPEETDFDDTDDVVEDLDVVNDDSYDY